MTVVDLVRVLLRQWLFVTAGAAAWIAVLWVAVHQPPVYFTQYDVVLLPPQESVDANTLRDTDYAMTPMAGLLVAEFNRGHRPVDLATSTTTLYGEGVTDGERVRLRRGGNQWRAIYEAPVIDVQVVGEDPEAVTARAVEVTHRLSDTLGTLQADQGVSTSSAMTLRNSPVVPVVQEVTGSRPRAAGAIALLGAVSTFWLAVILDGRLRRRGRTTTSRLSARPLATTPAR